MINAINDLRRTWQARARAMEDEILGTTNDVASLHLREKLGVLRRCLNELADAVDLVRYRPLTEASTGKLYEWSDRMVAIMDLMIEARRVGDDVELAAIGHELGELADQAFLDDMYDLFKQLANRGT